MHSFFEPVVGPIVQFLRVALALVLLLALAVALSVGGWWVGLPWWVFVPLGPVVSLCALWGKDSVSARVLRGRGMQR